MGRKVAMLVVGLLMTGGAGMAQSVISSSISLMNSDARVHKETDYIDDDGNAGRLTSFVGGDNAYQYTFVSSTEIGELFESYYVVYDQLMEVVIRKTDYNRPKFWTEHIAKANGDDEWYDPEKSVTEEVTYFFKDGNLVSWENAKGDEAFAITGADARREKLLRKRYYKMLSALQ